MRVRLTEEQSKQLEELSLLVGRTKSDIIRSLITNEYLRVVDIFNRKKELMSDAEYI
jgi:predicted DNA-binding protein